MLRQWPSQSGETTVATTLEDRLKAREASDRHNSDMGLSTLHHRKSLPLPATSGMLSCSANGWRVTRDSQSAKRLGTVAHYSHRQVREDYDTFMSEMWFHSRSTL